MSRGHVQMTGFSALLLLLVVGGTMFAAQYRSTNEAFDIGDYSAINIAQAEQVFGADGTNEQLVLIIKALCYRQEVLHETGWTEKLAAYGRTLYARARAGTVDLEKIDDEDAMLKVLKVLRTLGADR